MPFLPKAERASTFCYSFAVYSKKFWHSIPHFPCFPFQPWDKKYPYCYSERCHQQKLTRHPQLPCSRRKRWRSSKRRKNQTAEENIAKIRRLKRSRRPQGNRKRRKKRSFWKLKANTMWTLRQELKRKLMATWKKNSRRRRKTGLKTPNESRKSQVTKQRKRKVLPRKGSLLETSDETAVMLFGFCTGISLDCSFSAIWLFAPLFERVFYGLTGKVGVRNYDTIVNFTLLSDFKSV